jgi:NTE family protein
MKAMVSIGLVLGAGGVIGGAFHAGALAALADATGWDPRSADLIVGTSAGANTAASLRGGLSAADQFAVATDRPLSPEGEALTVDRPGRLRMPEPDANDHRPPWAYLPQAPWLVAPAFLRAGPARYGVAVAGLVPEGRISTAFLGERVRALHDDRWPEQPTWIVAYRTRDGRRVVFGRDDVDVPDLARAVEASSAAPGRFTPVSLPSGRYLDGAVFSPSNAGLVAGLGFDLVLISAPMSAPSTPSSDWSFGARARTWFTSLLRAEIEAIESKGTAVVVFEPTAEDLSVMYGAGGEDDRAPLVTDAVYRSVRARLDAPDQPIALELLSSLG